MSRIVFFNIPAHGHTNPTLGVVRALVSRGHEVWYYSYAPFQAQLEAAGARVVLCDAYDAEMRLRPRQAARVGKDLALSARLLVDTTLALDGSVCRDMEWMKPDCIVADSMAVWGKMIAQKLGIPFVSSTTTFAFNAQVGQLMGRSAGETLRMLLALPSIGRSIRRLQEKGYPVKSVLDLIASDERVHTVVYTSAQFQPCASSFPQERFAFVGPSIRPASEAVQKEREKLVYVSMGTVNNDMLPFYKACIHALAAMDVQAIFSVGSRVNIAALGKLPAHIEAHAQVDQIAVLREADAFITHCGMNSASEALYFGVPLVMRPQTSEQRLVARRAGELGAGVMLKGSSERAIREAVETVLGQASFRQRAQAIGEGFRTCTGAKGAAEKILAVAHKTE